MSWSVYLARCADESVYCGIAVDVVARIAAHDAGHRGALHARARAADGAGGAALPRQGHRAVDRARGQAAPRARKLALAAAPEASPRSPAASTASDRARPSCAGRTDRLHVFLTWRARAENEPTMDLPGLTPDATCDGQNRRAGVPKRPAAFDLKGIDGAADGAAAAQLGHPAGRPPAAGEDLAAAAHVPARAGDDRSRRAGGGEPADRHPGGRDPEGVQAGAGRRDERARGDARDDRERGARHPAGGAGARAHPQHRRRHRRDPGPRPADPAARARAAGEPPRPPPPAPPPDGPRPRQTRLGHPPR